MSVSALREICIYLFGDYTDFYFNSYNNSIEFKKYIDFCIEKKDKPEWNNFYRKESGVYYLPTFYLLDNTNFVINEIPLLKIYTIYQTILLRGTNELLYLRKDIKNEDELDVFINSISAPITPNFIKRFDLIDLRNESTIINNT